jgi:asparagine synthetase B (glutamine-hydrolysing)
VSGISGIWNIDGRPVDEALLGRMSGMLAHRGVDGEETWRDGEAGLALRETRHEVGRTLVGQSGAVLVFDGRLTTVPSWPLSTDHKVRGRSDELVSAGYDRHGLSS